MKEDSDEALMLSYAQGRITAFETLYGRYRQPLYAYYLRQVADEALANDLYQGCWEKVVAARERYKSHSPFRAWLFHIAHNHLMDHYRAQKPQLPLPDEVPDRGDTAPEQQVEGEDRRRRFLNAVQQLPDDQKDAILLRLEGELSLEDIARVTGVGPETAKSRLRYATRKLKELLQS